jgi:lipoprotein-anchoring transpeptidase ErfK/SrfK
MLQRYLQHSWLVTALLSSFLMLPAPAQNILDTPTSLDNVVTPVKEYVPRKNEVNLLLKVGERRVYVYRGTTVVKKFPVAVGKKGWETPTGDWKVQIMQKNPGWVNIFKDNKAFPPGPDNPLGERWIGFWHDEKTDDEIGFHGTTNLQSIGQAASHGCVRMSNKDVKMLYKMVQVGTVVRVRA